jgi:DNA-binding Lrp family transcriptional regulator
MAPSIPRRDRWFPPGLRVATLQCGSFTAGRARAAERSRVVVQAYILIQTEVGKARDVAAAIRDIAGVVRVDAVTGPYDVVVLTEARSVDELGKMIVSKVQLVPGITRTLTCSVVHL